MIIAAADERDGVERYPQTATAVRVQASRPRFVKHRLQRIATPWLIKSEECSDGEEHNLDDSSYNSSLDGDGLVLSKELIAGKSELEFETVDDSGHQNTITLDGPDGTDVFVKADTNIRLSIGTGRCKADMAVLEDCDEGAIIGHQVEDTWGAATGLGKMIARDVFGNFDGESNSSIGIDKWNTGIRV